MIEIKNRYTGAVLHTVDASSLSGADLSRANLSGANLSRADLSRANLSGANLSRADLSGANLSDAYLSGADLSDAYLSGADLSGANLSDAYLSGADLSDAYLSGANLSRANLSDAYLSGADLSRADLGDQWIIQGQTRSDGHVFFLQCLTADTEPMIKAGCRYFTLAQAQAHWEATRQVQTPALFAETRAIVRALVDTMHIRGLK